MLAVPLLLLTLAAPGLQLRVSSPYLDVVSRYRSGDHLKAVEELGGFPTVGLRDRARRDLLDLTCQILCGTRDCGRARAEKPDEFERVLEVWTGALPAAAALHIEAAVAAQIAGREEAADVHRALALEIGGWMEEQLKDLPAAGETAALRRQVALLEIWLLQIRLEPGQLDAPLARAQQQYPGDPLVQLAIGSLHEVRARPYALVEASEGRPGNVEAWRREERAFQLERAAAAYRDVIARDPGLAEAHLRLGRVLMLQGDRNGAETAFARVPESTEDRRWRYLAAMFRAAAAEEQDDREGTRARYEEALAIWPQSQSAQLAISRLLASHGDWEGARQRLAVLAPSEPSASPAEDPWWAYDFGQAWRIESGLAELRRLVRP
ncbi:MAG TPA: tetratricopeptide repeat protein [Vicinamibacterales bacterium]